MATLDQLISGELDKYKTDTISDIETKAKTERQYLDEYAEQLEKQSNELIGFKLGIISPAVQGTQAGVLERSPFNFGVDYASKLAEKDDTNSGIGFIIAAAVIGYFLLKGRK